MAERTEPLPVEQAGDVPLLAGLVSMDSRDPVHFPARDVLPDDAIYLDDTLPFARVLGNEAAGDTDRTLTVDALVHGSDVRMVVTVGKDVEYLIIHATREAWLACDHCGRSCVAYYNAADCSPPHYAVCVDCDGRHRQPNSTTQEAPR